MRAGLVLIRQFLRTKRRNPHVLASKKALCFSTVFSKVANWEGGEGGGAKESCCSDFD